MGNIIDYVKWRGDITFSKSPMNEVDGLIFSILSYLYFDAVIDKVSTESITIKEYAQLVKKNDYKILSMILVKIQNYEELLAQCAKSARFKNVKLSNYVNIFDPKEEIQFAAVTFELDDKTMVIAYRGTDDTVAGWKEDFNMGFLDVIPSQARALEYLKLVAEHNPTKKFYLTGHSKGGNLAIYSAIKSPLKINSRIIGILNYDGPGFLGDILEDATYQRILPKIRSIVPESSIVGMLLERKESETIVKTTAIGGFYQHDGFTWELVGTKFTHVKKRSIDSELIDKTLKSYLDKSTSAQRKQFADAISKIFEGYEGYTLTELTADKIKVINRVAKSYDGLDKETKSFLIASLRLIFSQGISAVKGTAQKESIKLPLPGILAKR